MALGPLRAPVHLRGACCRLPSAHGRTGSRPPRSHLTSPPSPPKGKTTRATNLTLEYILLYVVRRFFPHNTSPDLGSDLFEDLECGLNVFVAAPLSTVQTFKSVSFIQ